MSPVNFERGLSLVTIPFVLCPPFLSSMDICDSETGDGCGVFFARKASPGLCAKCTMLAILDEGSPEYIQWKVHNWTGQFFLLTDPQWVQYLFDRTTGSVNHVELLGSILHLQNADHAAAFLSSLCLALEMVSFFMSFPSKILTRFSSYPEPCPNCDWDFSHCSGSVHGCPFDKTTCHHIYLSYHGRLDLRREQHDNWWKQDIYQGRMSHQKHC